MINYSKVRESVQKTGSKKSLGRSINKSHTSSINIKLKEEGERYRREPSGQKQWTHKKYSVKLQSTEKENANRKKEINNYDLTIFRPCQETNRHLETDRVTKDFKPPHERTPFKHHLRLKTDHSDMKPLKTDHSETKCLRTDYDASESRSGQIVRVPAKALRSLMGELMGQQKQVAELRREIEFYRKHGGEGAANSVLKCLRV